MENTQSSPNQNLTEATAQQQTSPSNSKLLIVVTISVLLTTVITGLAVYIWQKSANEEAIGSMEQKIASLEEQVSMTEITKMKLLDDSQKTRVTEDINKYETDKDYFEYPAVLAMDPNYNSIIMYDPAKSIQSNHSVVLTDINGNEVRISKSVYKGVYGDEWGYGPGWEEKKAEIEYDASLNTSGLNATVLSQRAPDEQSDMLAKIYVLSDENKNFTYEIIMVYHDQTFIDKSEIIVKSIKNKNFVYP